MTGAEDRGEGREHIRAKVTWTQCQHQPILDLMLQVKSIFPPRIKTTLGPGNPVVWNKQREKKSQCALAVPVLWSVPIPHPSGKPRMRSTNNTPSSTWVVGHSSFVPLANGPVATSWACVLTEPLMVRVFFFYKIQRFLWTWIESTSFQHPVTFTCTVLKIKSFNRKDILFLDPITEGSP